MKRTLITHYNSKCALVQVSQTNYIWLVNGNNWCFCFFIWVCWPFVVNMLQSVFPCYSHRPNILIYRAIWRNYFSLIRDKFHWTWSVFTPFSQRRRMILCSSFYIEHGLNQTHSYQTITVISSYFILHLSIKKWVKINRYAYLNSTQKLDEDE